MKVVRVLLGMLVGGSVATAVQAQETATTTVGQISEQLEQMSALATGGMFLIGIFLAVMAMFQFKAHSENPSEHPIAGALVKAVLASIMLGSATLIPALIEETNTTETGIVQAKNTTPAQSQDEETDERTFKTGRDPGKKKTGF